MGLFDRLRGKQGDSASKPFRPKVLGELDGTSLFVLLDDGNGDVTVMDREMFDYRYGESDAPDPAQRDLDEMLPAVTRVRVIASEMFHGRAVGSEVVLERSDEQSLTALRSALRIVEDPSRFGHCACLGGPTIELFSDQGLAATIGLHHGTGIRWTKWKHDAELVDGQALKDWLTEYGMEPAFLDVLFNNQYGMGGPLGYQRTGPAPLSRSEQRLRLAELTRVRGGDPARAIADCQTVLEEEPALAFGYAVRALVHRQQRDHARCVADCTEAIRLGLDDAEMFFVRAVAQDHLGDTQKALADCTAALEIDPGHVNALNSRGLIRARLGMVDDALVDLNEAVARAPKWSLGLRGSEATRSAHW